jgi:hypothetical protein
MSTEHADWRALAADGDHDEANWLGWYAEAAAAVRAAARPAGVHIILIDGGWHGCNTATLAAYGWTGVPDPEAYDDNWPSHGLTLFDGWLQNPHHATVAYRHDVQWTEPAELTTVAADLARQVGEAVAQ